MTGGGGKWNSPGESLRSGDSTSVRGNPSVHVTYGRVRRSDDGVSLESHNHDFQLPNCINVDPKDLLINQLSATTFSCLSLNVSSLKKHFLTLQTDITDNYRPSVIGLCETKIDSNIEQLYCSLAGYN